MMLLRLFVATTLFALSAAPVAAAETNIEAGAFVNYVAPDAGGPTTGSITFGFLGDPETIAADAVISPAAATWLPNLSGGVPTCISVTREAGVITALDFAPACTVSGTLSLEQDVFGPGADAYALSDRVVIPAHQVSDESSPEFNPGFNALMATAFDAGADLNITLATDPSTGIPQSMSATTQITGPVVIEPDGDIAVGAATLLDEVLDPATRAALVAAADAGVAATVAIAGSGPIDIAGGPIVIDLSFTVTAGMPPSTPMPSASPDPALLPDTAVDPPSNVAIGVVIVLAVSGYLAVGAAAASSGADHRADPSALNRRATRAGGSRGTPRRRSLPVRRSTRGTLDANA